MHSTLCSEKLKTEKFSRGIKSQRVVTRGRSFNSHRTSPCFYIPLWTAPRHASELFLSRYLPISSSVLRDCRGHIAEPRRRCYDSDHCHVFSRGPRSHFSLLCETNQKLVTPPSPEMASRHRANIDGSRALKTVGWGPLPAPESISEENDLFRVPIIIPFSENPYGWRRAALIAFQRRC